MTYMEQPYAVRKLASSGVLVRGWSKAIWHIKVLLVVGMLFAIPSLATANTQLSSFDDCSDAALKTLRERIYRSGTNPRPVILSRDVLHFDYCMSSQPNSRSKVLLSTLDKHYLIEVREIQVQSRSPLAQAARDACDGLAICAAELYRRKGHNLPEQFVPFAPSGGLPFAHFLGHVGDDGHYEITRAAIEELSLRGQTWSTDSAEILQLAARDADFYEWENPAAHAQTANYEDARLKETEADAQNKFVRWAAEWLKKAREACVAGKHREALYLVGYSLHGIQDLVFHEGISNAEHSYRDFVLKEGVDINKNQPVYADKMALAKFATSRLLDWFVTQGLPQQSDCWGKMRQLRVSAISTEEKRTLLSKKGTDFGVLAYGRYRALSSSVKEAQLNTENLKGTYFIETPWLKNRSRDQLENFLRRIAEVFHEKN